jgi:hypothetical protein
VEELRGAEAIHQAAVHGEPEHELAVAPYLSHFFVVINHF